MTWRRLKGQGKEKARDGAGNGPISVKASSDQTPGEI